MKMSRIKFLIFLLIVIFVFFSFKLMRLTIQMQSDNKTQDIILNLKLQNNEIDRYFNNKLILHSYDEINKIFHEFGEGIFELSKISVFDHESIISINKIYNEKLQLMEKFNFINASSIATLIDSENSIKNSKDDIYTLKILLLKIKNSKFDSVKDINEIENEIQALSFKFYNKPNSSAANLLLRRINFILNSISQMNEIYEKNKNLNLTAPIKKLSNIYKEYNKTIIKQFRSYFMGELIIFMALIILSIILVIKHNKTSKDLAMYKTAIDNGFSSIIFTNKKNLITYANDTFYKTTEYKTEETIGKDPKFLKSYLHSNNYYGDIKNAIENAKEFYSDEFVSKSKNGKYLYESVKFIPFIYEGNYLGYIGVKLDRTKEISMLRELELKNQQLKEQSAVDKLTGFGNYFAMSESLDRQKDGIIISISIKNFDNLRFFYQTRIIEAMLLSFANTLKLCIQTSEINAELFRFQDDEFYIWYNGDNATEDVGHIQDYFSFTQMEIKIDDKTDVLPGLKAIVGISLPFDTIQTNRLMQAILAKEQAKNLGIEVYEYKENDAIELRYYKNQTTTQLIEYALENNTIMVECQGIFEIDKPNEKPTYYEVLVRIIDQNGKIRYPGEFLEVALQAQLYTQITKKIIEHAFMLVERYPKYTFSINLSGVDIIDNSVREFLEEKLQLCSDPSRVCFEILESEEIEDYTVMNSFIKNVKGYGSKISIDDFGSGYSNYYRILDLEIDTIKIDGSIIKKLPFDKNAQSLVETIVNFASKQNYKMVAEFVSSPEIFEQVKKFGIHYAQGFLLGKPSSIDNL